MNLELVKRFFKNLTKVNSPINFSMRLLSGVCKEINSTIENFRLVYTVLQQSLKKVYALDFLTCIPKSISEYTNHRGVVPLRE